MAVYRRDLRYVTTHLWPRGITIALLCLPVIVVCTQALPWLTFGATTSGPGLPGWFKNGRSLCSVALISQLCAALLLGPFVGVRLVLSETREGTLEVLQTTPLSGLEIFLDKLRVAYALCLPFLFMNLPVLALGWLQGWMPAAEIVLSLLLSAELLALAIAFAMAVTSVARAPEIAYPVVYLLLGAFAAGIPPFTTEPEGAFGWLFLSPFAAALFRFAYKGGFPITPAEWTGILVWCAAATVGCAMAGARMFFAGDAERRKKVFFAFPYVAGAALVAWLAVAGLASKAVGSSSASAAGLVVAGLVLAGRCGRLPGLVARDPLVRKELAFYGSGGLRVLRDLLVFVICAYGLFLSQHPERWHPATGAAWPLLQGVMVVVLFLGVALGATSLTLERSLFTFELLMLTPLPAERVHRGKLIGIVGYLSPLAGTVVLFTAVAGGWAPGRIVGAFLAVVGFAPWLMGAIYYGMAVGAGAKSNTQALCACLGIFWLVTRVWDSVNFATGDLFSLMWGTLKAGLSPFFFAEQSLTLGADFPSEHPLGILGALVLYLVLARLMLLALHAGSRQAARSVDPWGDVGVAKPKAAAKGRS